MTSLLVRKHHFPGPFLRQIPYTSLDRLETGYMFTPSLISIHDGRMPRWLRKSERRRVEDFFFEHKRKPPFLLLWYKQTMDRSSPSDSRIHSFDRVRGIDIHEYGDQMIRLTWNDSIEHSRKNVSIRWNME
jgi:hypothetical protein